MVKMPVRIAALGVLLALMAGCGGDIAHQSEFRGKWVLETRTLPDGKLLQPPQVSGVLEWFPLSEEKSHVTVAFSVGEGHVQLADYVNTLKRSTIFRENSVDLQGGYRPSSGPTERIPRTTTEGKVSVQDSVTTLAYDDGVSCRYEGATLIYTHSDGTVDTWKRTDDQKGLLTK